MSETTEPPVLAAREHRHPWRIDSRADPLAKTRRSVRGLALVASAMVGAGLVLVAAANGLDEEGRSPTAAVWAGGIGLLFLIVGLPTALWSVRAGRRWRHVQRLTRRGVYLPITPEEAELLDDAQQALSREAGGEDIGLGAFFARLMPADVEEVCLDLPADLASLTRRAEQTLSALQVGDGPRKGWWRRAATEGTTEAACDGCVRRRCVSARRGLLYSEAPVVVTIDLEPLGDTTTRAHVRVSAKAARESSVHRQLQTVVDGLTRDHPTHGLLGGAEPRRPPR